MSQPLLSTVKALFAKSRNKCAFPDCGAPLVEASGTVTGEICNIRAEKSRGPRYDKSYPEDRRNAAENLILMCGRHHKVIDTETRTYKTEELLRIKQNHEEGGVVEISPQIAKSAQALLAHHDSINVSNNSGQLAINSPGAILAGVVNLKTNRSKVVTPSPLGAIGASQPMSAYCKYLVARYNEYQKADFTGKSDSKYMVLPNAVIRKFGNRWQDLPEAKFSEVVTFLQARIDATIIGKRNRARSIENYHSFHEHGR
ncbi:MAG: HNH endonuclease [Gammaproteobacteria bacterium]|nr:HNH endonuclease [Gammaproteobacteria bacterium]